MVSNRQIPLTATNNWQHFDGPHTLHEDVSELEILPNGGIHLTAKTLDELDWKTKTKLLIIEQDNDLHQITLGKELQGEEFVDALNKLRDRF